MRQTRSIEWTLALAVLGSGRGALAQAQTPPPPPAANAGEGEHARHRGGGPAAEGDFARRYAQGSVGLVQNTGLVSAPGASTLLVTGAPGGGPVGVLGFGAAVRITTHHFLVEPMLGFATGAVLVTGTATTAGAFITGVGLGGVVPLSSRLALSPMGRLTFNVPFGANGVITYVMGELPFTIFLGRNGYIEPYVAIGAVVGSYSGLGTGPYGLFAMGAGYRLGVVF